MTLVAAGLAAAGAWLSFRPGPVCSRSRSAGGRWWWPVLAATTLWWLLGPVATLIVAVGWAVRELVRVRTRRRESTATAARVLETCELLGADVAAGQPPDRSLARAAAAWPALAPVAEASALGGDVPRAMRELSQRPGAGDLRSVAAAWAVAHRSGAGLTDALDRVAARIRADHATSRVVQGELTSARATARLIAVLPALVLLVGGGDGAATLHFLVETPLGLVCLVAGLGLGLLGLWWIERIADAVVR